MRGGFAESRSNWATSHKQKPINRRTRFYRAKFPKIIVSLPLNFYHLEPLTTARSFQPTEFAPDRKAGQQAEISTQSLICCGDIGVLTKWIVEERKYNSRKTNEHPLAHSEHRWDVWLLGLLTVWGFGTQSQCFFFLFCATNFHYLFTVCFNNILNVFRSAELLIIQVSTV